MNEIEFEFKRSVKGLKCTCGKIARTRQKAAPKTPEHNYHLLITSDKIQSVSNCVAIGIHHKLPLPAAVPATPRSPKHCKSLTRHSTCHRTSRPKRGVSWRGYAQLAKNAKCTAPAF